MYQIDNDPEVILSELVYDELGRATQKKLLDKGEGFIQQVTYKYNIRNWLKYISSPAFTQTLYYNESFGGNTPSYNGNISAMTWDMYYNYEYHRYNFTYDGLNRLKQSTYSPDGAFDEIIGYDKMGNITQLERWAAEPYSPRKKIDDLYLSYSGNRLAGVTEIALAPDRMYGFTNQVSGGSAPTEYSYNANGATKHDANTGISLIEYNSLNLPEQISFYKGDVNFYKYDAMGQKRQVKHLTARSGIVVPIGSTNSNYSSTTQHELTTDYLASGSIIYEGNHLKMIRTEEGYITGSSNYYSYYINLKDHLGNNRAVIEYGYGGSWYLSQEISYYPFGMPHPFGNQSPERQPFKYSGKELDEMHGLKHYDFHARQLSSVVPRFTTRDPHAESYFNTSPYAYCLGNPMIYVDPNGMDIYMATPDGRVLLIKRTDDNYDMLYNGSINDDGSWDLGSLSVKVNDTDLLSQLSSTREIHGKLEHGEGGPRDAMTANRLDAFNVFWLLATSTSVEWSLSGFRGNHGTLYYINTMYSPNYADVGIDRFFVPAGRLIFNVHSHPDANGTKGGSGYYYGYDMKTKTTFLEKVYSNLDYGNTKRHPHVNWYVYHPYSSNLYQYTKQSMSAETWENMGSGASLMKYVK
jgi:RHS repeat-associated protein